MLVVAIAAALLATASTAGAPPTAAPQAMPSGTQDLKAGTYTFDFPLLDALGKPLPAVSLGGYHGKYLEWSVPVDARFSDCDSGPGDTVGFFKSWTSDSLSYPRDTGDRFQQGPGQVDRLWILEVEGPPPGDRRDLHARGDRAGPGGAG